LQGTLTGRGEDLASIITGDMETSQSIPILGIREQEARATVPGNGAAELGLVSTVTPMIAHLQRPGNEGLSEGLRDLLRRKGEQAEEKRAEGGGKGNPSMEGL